MIFLLFVFFFEVKYILKRFLGVWVLYWVSFMVNRSEVVFVIGENGVGKSMLMKIFVGV